LGRLKPFCFSIGELHPWGAKEGLQSVLIQHLATTVWEKELV
jgi:hypothetical protein